VSCGSTRSFVLHLQPPHLAAQLVQRGLFAGGLATRDAIVYVRLGTPSGAPTRLDFQIGGDPVWLRASRRATRTTSRSNSTGNARAQRHCPTTQDPADRVSTDGAAVPLDLAQEPTGPTRHRHERSGGPLRGQADAQESVRYQRRNLPPEISLRLQSGPQQCSWSLHPACARRVLRRVVDEAAG
jgi:hypothetical protein